MSAVQDKKNTPVTELPDTDKPKTPDTPDVQTSKPDVQAPQTPDVPKTDGGVEMPAGTPVDPQAKQVKKLDKDTTGDDQGKKLQELIKILEIDYPMVRQLL